MRGGGILVRRLAITTVQDESFDSAHWFGAAQGGKKGAKREEGCISLRKYFCWSLRPCILTLRKVLYLLELATKADLIQPSISALSEKEREILVRFYLRDQPETQIFHEMDLTETELSSQESRVKRKVLRFRDEESGGQRKYFVFSERKRNDPNLAQRLKHIAARRGV